MRGWEAGAVEAGALVQTGRIREAVEPVEAFERAAAEGVRHDGAGVGGGWCDLSKRVQCLIKFNSAINSYLP